MHSCGNLALEQTALNSGAEWEVPFPGWCFVRIGEGTGYWIGRLTRESLSVGDMLVLSPLREGVLRASELGFVRIDFFRFSPELFADFLTVVERNKFEQLSVLPSYGVRRFTARDAGAELFSETCASHLVKTLLSVRCDLLRVVAKTFAEELQRTQDPTQPKLWPEERLRFLINQTPEVELLSLTAKDIAAECQCTVRSINRIFLERYNMSFRAKQREIRVRRARQLLEGGRPLDEVAKELGFESVKALGREFKKAFKVTPAQWCRPSLKKIKKAGGRDNSQP